MNTPPSADESRRRSISLSRLATICAVAFAIAFGLCTVSVVSSSMGLNQTIAVGFVWVSIAVECISLVALVAIGLIALIQFFGS